MIYKIATHTTPEMVDWTFDAEEEKYWDSLCSICYNRECDEDCILIIPGIEDCGDCFGTGRVKYMVRPEGKPPYYLITLCGMCEGVGMV